MISLTKRLEPYTVDVARCPWCNETARVFIRAGSELVCRECVWMSAALEAGDDNE
jgi:ribosomal protein S27E